MKNYPTDRNSKNNKLKSLPFAKLFPNIVTIAAICFGLSSIRYALDEKWEISVLLIIIAGFLDVVDGRLARYLKATSNFGAYLDSLADFIDFGVAPAIVLYLWNLRNIEIKGLGWALVLFFSVCMAIRLARFNSDLDEETRPEWKDMFFTGVPAPAGAYLAIIPMMLSFRFDIDFSKYIPFVGTYMILVALLLVSTIPTFSLKKIVIAREHVPLFFVLTGFVIAMVIIEPWIALPFIGLTYLSIIPFGMAVNKKYRNIK